MPSGSEVAVVGAGIVGLSVAEALGQRGVAVSLWESGEPGAGQSAGAGRIFRRLHADPDLLRLVDRARLGWLAWGERAGEPLLEPAGWLRRGGDRTPELAALGAVELAPAQALDRLPLLAPQRGPLLFDPAAGSLRADRAVAALAGWTVGIRRHAAVRRIRPLTDGVALDTTAGEHRCARCLICAGAGTDALAQTAGLEFRQQRRAHLRLTFRLRRPGPAPLPAWSDRSGDFGELVYGVPDGPDRYALGLANLTGYPEVPGPAPEIPPGADLTGVRRRIIRYAAAAFPGLDPEPVAEVARLTTGLPGRDDDAFELRWDGPVAAFGGGNLFKFAPVLGPALADAVLAGSGAQTSIVW